MAVWSTKRRFIYGGSVVLVISLISISLFFKIFYRAPTCTDGVKNADERGVDCGGACKNLCTADALNPIIIWAKTFNISGDVYTSVAYAENPNLNSKNQVATYQFRIFDANNNVITVKEGQTSIPKGKRFAVFENGIVLKGEKPKSTEFKFLTFGQWEKDLEKEPEINIKHSTLIATTTVPRIEGVVTNDSLSTIDQMELDVFVLDSKENVVAASRTFIDTLLARSSQDFVFTWPKAFNLGVEECVNPVDIAMVLDRSGSMKSESVEPPEPFTTVKLTAQDFIKNLGDEDAVFVVSFGDDARLESVLSPNKQLSVSAINSLHLSSTTLEQTNIFDGLTSAFNILTAGDIRSNSKKIIVLLTDGVPTRPTQVGLSDYPIISAEGIAKNLKDANVTIYTIGLGKTLNEGFLRGVASDDSDYFLAPDKTVLSDIYKKISSKLCAKKPSVINVIYRRL